MLQLSCTQKQGNGRFSFIFLGSIKLFNIKKLEQSCINKQKCEYSELQNLVVILLLWPFPGIQNFCCIYTNIRDLKLQKLPKILVEITLKIVLAYFVVDFELQVCRVLSGSWQTATYTSTHDSDAVYDLLW